MTESRALPATYRRWPMTPDAARSLAEEIGKLRRHITDLAAEGLEEGVVHLALAQAMRRLETLNATQRSAEVMDARDRALIGRRATVRHADGELSCYAIVYPGDGDPTRSRVSADSPLGSALLGAMAGASIDVPAPGGSWSVRVLAIE